jgi:branched-chain amino acid transport system ATP-binding protein
MSDDTILEARELEKRFGGVRAIAGVNFRLRRGELRCLIGPNGAGKSTFFKMLTAQLSPSRGLILFNGLDITRTEQHRIARLGIGIKNQVPSVFDGLTVHEGLWLAAAASGAAKGDIEAVVDATLDQLGLVPIADRIVGLLAHGQRQWVELGMVMARRPSVILLDEPTAGMSAEEVRRTAGLIRELNRTAALVVVEHDMQFIRDIAKMVTVFHQGRILMEGTISEVQSDPRVRAVYLGTRSHA